MSALCASAGSRPRQDARTSRAVTGAPSQNRALSRNVNAQRSPDAWSQLLASPGRGRPWQSSRINDSYNCPNTSRSASFRGRGACAAATGSETATETVSRATVRPLASMHVVSPGAGVGGGTSTCGPPPRHAAASKPRIAILRCRLRRVTGRNSGITVEGYPGLEAPCHNPATGVACGTSEPGCSLRSRGIPPARGRSPPHGAPDAARRQNQRRGCGG